MKPRKAFEMHTGQVVLSHWDISTSGATDNSKRANVSLLLTAFNEYHEEKIVVCEAEFPTYMLQYNFRYPQYGPC